MQTLWQDLRYGARMLAKKPGLTLVVVLTLGLGIGANATIFSAVNALLLRPLPVKDPEQIVALGMRDNHLEFPHGLSYEDFLDYREKNEALSDLALYWTLSAGLSHEGRAERAIVDVVSANYFSLLGVDAIHGRTFLPDEDRVEGANPLMVLGYGYWQRAFGGNPQIIGETVKLNGHPFTVIGIAPKNFKGILEMLDKAAYVPISMVGQVAPGTSLRGRANHNFQSIGRLKPGVSREQAESALNVVAAQLAQAYPDTNAGVGIVVVPETEARPDIAVSSVMPRIFAIFMLLVGLVLLVVCANVANLLLARATGRTKEMAIRAAIGAGRGRLLRQLLTETALLALIGGALGLTLAFWATDLLASVGNNIRTDAVIDFNFSPDWRVYGFTLLVALIAGVIAGIAPAFRSVRADLIAVLKEGGRSSSGAARHRLSNLLVVSQMAVSLALLVGAWLFVQSMLKAKDIDMGFRQGNLLMLSMEPELQGYDEARSRRFYDDLAARVKNLSGVESASVASFVPFSGNTQGVQVSIEGAAVVKESEQPMIFSNFVDADYFQTMGVPLLRGRAFSSQDKADTTRVAIINETMARKFWPQADALGKRIRISERESERIEVVGIARDGKYMLLTEEPRPFLYLPLAQASASRGILHVRATVDPLSLVAQVRQEIRALDSDLPVFDVKSLDAHLSGSVALAPVKLGAMLVGSFSLIAVLLAIVGLYGVISYSVSQRTQEIGVRLALGAQTGDVLKMIVGQGAKLVLAGMLIGLLAAFGLARLLASLLVGVNATDPLTFAMMALLLGAIGLLACWLPARRAVRVDPMVALRYE